MSSTVHGLLVDEPGRELVVVEPRGRLIVRASFSALNDVDTVSQVFLERMTLEAVEDETRRVYRQTHLSRMVFPQEMKSLVALAGASTSCSGSSASSPTRCWSARGTRSDGRRAPAAFLARLTSPPSRPPAHPPARRP
jgi:hypothetical protein